MLEFFLTNQNNAADCINLQSNQYFKIAQFSHLKIDHQEGKPAELVLKIEMPYRQAISEAPLSKYGYGYLIYQEATGNGMKKILFFGKWRETITGTEDMTFIFIADIAPFQEQWDTLVPPIQKEHPPHEVWTREDPETMLASAPYLLYWDRCTGKLGISHVRPNQLCLGQNPNTRKTYPVHLHYDPQHRHHRVRAPLTSVHVEMVARWDEIGLRYLNIGQQIERQFPNQRICTATPLSLERGWPKISRLSNRYFISQSTLTEKSTRRYRIQGHHQEKSMVVECKFYDAQLEVGLIYRQPREETLQYVLTIPTAHSESGRTESLKISVPPFVQDALFPVFRYHHFYQNGDIVQQAGRVYQYRSESTDYSENIYAKDINFSDYADVWHELPEYSKRVLPVFSNTIFGLGPDSESMKLDLGKEFMEYSLQCAKMKFLKDRSHCIELRGTLYDWHAITLNDTIQIDDLDDSNGTKMLSCKVIRYQLEYTNGSMELAHINLEAAVEVDRLCVQKQPIADGNLRKPIVIHGVEFEWSKDSPKACPILNKPDNEFCHVIVVNKAREQIQAIQDHLKNAKPWTKNLPIDNKNTKILIKSKTQKEEADASKNQKRFLEHTIHLVARVDSESWLKV